MTNKEHVENLIKKASEATDSCDAMRFAQAALNAAQAINTLILAATMKSAG